jgi:protoporphyrinogen oxidase
MAGLEDMKLLKPAETQEYFSVRTQRLYPVYEKGMREKIDKILNYVESFNNVRSIGRHGFFQHNNSDNAMDMGIQAADHLLRQETMEQWRNKRDEFHSYQIVD